MNIRKNVHTISKNKNIFLRKKLKDKFNPKIKKKKKEQLKQLGKKVKNKKNVITITL